MSEEEQKPKENPKFPPGERETKELLTAAEALFGYVGWLSTREHAVVLSKGHDISPWNGLIRMFLAAHGEELPTEGFDKKLVSMGPYEQQHS